MKIGQSSTPSSCQVASWDELCRLSSSNQGSYAACYLLRTLLYRHTSNPTIHLNNYLGGHFTTSRYLDEDAVLYELCCPAATKWSLRDGSPGAAIGHHDIIRSLQRSSPEAAAIKSHSYFKAKSADVRSSPAADDGQCRKWRWWLQRRQTL